MRPTPLPTSETLRHGAGSNGDDNCTPMCRQRSLARGLGNLSTILPRYSCEGETTFKPEFHEVRVRKRISQKANANSELQNRQRKEHGKAHVSRAAELSIPGVFAQGRIVRYCNVYIQYSACFALTSQMRIWLGRQKNASIQHIWYVNYTSNCLHFAHSQDLFLSSTWRRFGYFFWYFWLTIQAWTACFILGSEI